ncbi:MAG: RDD family protein [Caldisericia bacterium]|nr:RDD family protein [Caldisericia bacterium]
MKFVNEEDLEQPIHLAQEREIAEEISQKIERGELTRGRIDEEVFKKLEKISFREEWQKNYAKERIKKMIGDEIDARFLPATWTRRFLNLLLDWGGYYIFSFFIGFVLGISGFYFIIEDMNDYLLGFFIWTIYFVIFESIWSKTPGKFITRTKVIMEDGTKPPLRTIIIRALIRFVPFEAFSFLASSRPRGWHDKWSKTIVIEDNKKNYKIINKAESTQVGEEENIVSGLGKSIKKIKYCSQCGCKLEKNSKFCPECGVKI